jgi:hypothetical protein
MRQEIGIRMALSARPGDVFRTVLRSGVALLAAGLAIGLAASVALARLIPDQLFEAPPLGPVAFGVVTALLSGRGAACRYRPSAAEHADRPGRDVEKMRDGGLRDWESGIVDGRGAASENGRTSLTGEAMASRATGSRDSRTAPSGAAAGRVRSPASLPPAALAVPRLTDRGGHAVIASIDRAM